MKITNTFKKNIWVTQEKLDITFPSILISLMPFFLITGPFLSDLSLLIVIFFYLFNSIKEKKFYSFK